MLFTYINNDQSGGGCTKANSCEKIILVVSMYTMLWHRAVCWWGSVEWRATPRIDYCTRGYASGQIPSSCPYTVDRLDVVVPLQV